MILILYFFSFGLYLSIIRGSPESEKSVWKSSLMWQFSRAEHSNTFWQFLISWIFLPYQHWAIVLVIMATYQNCAIVLIASFHKPGLHPWGNPAQANRHRWRPGICRNYDFDLEHIDQLSYSDSFVQGFDHKCIFIYMNICIGLLMSAM